MGHFFGWLGAHDAVFYWFWVLPILADGLVLFRFRAILRRQVIRDTVYNERRSDLYIPMIGFSFAALLAIAVVDINLQRSLAVTTLDLLLSFLAYLSGLIMLDNFGTSFWWLILDGALSDVGVLGLLLAVGSVVYKTYPGGFGLLFVVASLSIWGANYAISWFRMWNVVAPTVRDHPERLRPPPAIADPVPAKLDEVAGKLDEVLGKFDQLLGKL